jgi:hypothetical protein
MLWRILRDTGCAMTAPRFFIWTGGSDDHDPDDFARADALPALPAPDPLPRAARITFWWGRAQFEVLAVACSVRTTAWGSGRVTWLHCEQTRASAAETDAPSRMTNTLIPAGYVTAVTPGPSYHRDGLGRSSGDVAVYPPRHPPPPHALPLAAVERALAGLAEWPTAEGWHFSVSYPVFALALDAGGYFGSEPAPGSGNTDRAIPVFTTGAKADAFLRLSNAPARVERFDRVGAFRRFLRAIRDAGTVVLFDPVSDAANVLHADRAYPAAVILERFLPQVAWGWSYPVYLLRRGDGFAVAGGTHDGRRVTLLPVFTDTDLAGRALATTPRPASVVGVADRDTFGRLIRALPPAVWGVVFDPPDPPDRRVAHTALSRENLLADLEDLEL